MQAVQARGRQNLKMENHFCCLILKNTLHFLALTCSLVAEEFAHQLCFHNKSFHISQVLELHPFCITVILKKKQSMKENKGYSIWADMEVLKICEVYV